MHYFWLSLCLLLAAFPFSLKAQSDEWQQLFNGKDLAGWKHVGPGGDKVEDGLIRTYGGMGLLYWTGGKLGNCVIRVRYKMRDFNDNSGVFIRIPIEPREEWMPVHYGYEVQIDNHPETSDEDEYHITGTLYSLTKPLAKPGKPGPEWNIMEITLDGPRTVVNLNGVKVTDYREGDPVPEKKFDFEPQRGPRPLEGYIGLQNHSDSDVVFFQEVAVKKLEKEHLRSRVTKAKKQDGGKCIVFPARRSPYAARGRTPCLSYGSNSNRQPSGRAADFSPSISLRRSKIQGNRCLN